MMAPQKAGQNPVTWNGSVRSPAMTLVSQSSRPLTISAARPSVRT